MASGHLVADRKLTLHCDEDLDHLDHARRKFVTLLQLGDLLVVDVRKDVDLTLGALLVFLDLGCNIDTAGRDFDLTKKLRIKLLKHLASKRYAFLDDHVAAIFKIVDEFAAFE